MMSQRVDWRSRCLGVVAIAVVLWSVQTGRAQSPEEQGPPPAKVRVGQAQEMALQERWSVVGRLREVRRVVVSAEQQGRLVAVEAEEGAPITAGQVLAQIEDVWAQLTFESSQAKLEQARAQVDQSKANLEQASRDLGYLEDLFRAGSAKPREVDDQRTTQVAARATLASAEASVLEAQAEVERAKAELDKLQVVAPFDGVVVRKMVEVGQYVTRGSQVAEIVSRGPIDAVIHVPEQFISIVSTDMEIEVNVEPIGQILTGKVVAVVPDASNAARTFPVKVRLDDADGSLKPGMSVIASIPTMEVTQVMTVPRDAVLRGVDGTTVWIAGDGVAMPLPVKILFGHEDRYAVQVQNRPGMPGLASGMNVIIEGGERLMFPGQPIAVLNQ